jgi:glycerol-3-phosphate dehydrogenase
MMAEETLDKAIKARILRNGTCITKDLKLNSIPAKISSEHLQIYGEQAVEIEKMINDNPALGVPLSPVLPYSKAEIIWICRNEMPVTLEDILARRTRALFLDATASEAIAPEVAWLMAQELGFNDTWQKDQLETYGHLIKSYF